MAASTTPGVGRRVPTTTADSAGRGPRLVSMLVFAAIFVVGLPLANLLGFLSDYYLNLFGKYLALAILALGLDLLWGYAGILSLGQAIFFGIGAYSIGMYMLLLGSGKGGKLLYRPRQRTFSLAITPLVQPDRQGVLISLTF